MSLYCVLFVCFYLCFSVFSLLHVFNTFLPCIYDNHNKIIALFCLVVLYLFTRIFVLLHITALPCYYTLSCITLCIAFSLGCSQNYT